MSVDFADRADIGQILGSCSDLGSVCRGTPCDRGFCLLESKAEWQQISQQC